MKMIVLYVLAGLAVLLAVAYGVGSMMPRDHVATVSQEYVAPAERIYAVITAPEHFMKWRTGLSKVDVAGERITEHSSYGVMSYRFVEAAPPHRVQTEVDETGAEERGFSGSWTFDIAPTGAGSRLTITERGKVFSPLFRVMARYVFGYEGTMRQYHADLAKRLAEGP